MPRVERFTVAFGKEVSLDGERYTFTGMTPPSPPATLPNAVLTFPDGVRTLDVARPGCTQQGGWVYALEELEPGDAAWARFARARVEAGPRLAACDAAFAVAVGDIVRLDDGATLHVDASRGYPDLTVGVHVVVSAGGTSHEETVIAGSPGGAATYIDDEHVIAIATTDARGALGCPGLRARVECPRRRIVDVGPDGEVTLQREARARLGGVTVRFLGLGEKHLTDGSYRAMVLLAAEGPDGPSTVDCETGPCEIAGLTIEIREVDATHVRMRISRTRRP